jgi:hypothetical protein
MFNLFFRLKVGIHSYYYFVYIIANAINKIIWYEINSNLLYKFNFFNENFKVEHVYKTT